MFHRMTQTFSVILEVCVCSDRSQFGATNPHFKARTKSHTVNYSGMRIVNLYSS